MGRNQKLEEAAIPWSTPTLRQVRETVRGEVTTSLGRASLVGNSVLRVMADATAALTHLTLRYIDWLALQFLPDTAETEWIDRHGIIWLVNSDNTVGRKSATFAAGSATVTGVAGIQLPIATQLVSTDEINFETTELIVLNNVATPVKIRATNPGTVGNLLTGEPLTFIAEIEGLDRTATILELHGGTNEETDEELRQRVLKRIRQPPMGGAVYDYEAWALAVPGVTRAWAAQEMGIGTATVRFMMDDKRTDNDGVPLEEDVIEVTKYIDYRRPVAVKDTFVVAPLKQPISITIAELNPDTPSVRQEIEDSLLFMLRALAKPGQTIYAAWKSYAVMNTSAIVSFQLVDTEDDLMESVGHIAVLENIIYTEDEISELPPYLPPPEFVGHGAGHAEGISDAIGMPRGVGVGTTLLSVFSFALAISTNANGKGFSQALGKAIAIGASNRAPGTAGGVGVATGAGATA